MQVARLRRLASKPPGYVVRRAADEARRELQRAVVRRAAAGRGRHALDRILPGDAAAVLERTAAAAVALVPQGVGGVTPERLARARAREMDLFGDAPVFAGIPPRWLDDVRSGHGWPLQDHRRLDYRNLGRASDVKVAWELSRLRHLVALAQSATPDDVAVIGADLESWVRANPVGWSVNWACAMEIALRAVNLICVDGLLLRAGRPLPQRDLLARTLYQHGWFLVRNLEISDLNGNHYVADAVGLVWLGRYFEGLGEADRWYRTGREMLVAAATDQVFPDGLDHEGSLPYHALVLEMFLTARMAGRDLAALDAVLARMGSALATVAGLDGRIPDLGDDDGGRVLAFDDRPSNDARRVLEPAGDPAPAARPVHLAHGGVVVLGGGDDHVVVSTGPVGFRGRGGHGHLDACSFEATLGGRLLVRDSGTGSYTGDPGLRNELRDAPAHSVWILDGLPYARIGDEERLWVVEGDSPPEVVSLEGDEREQTLVVRQPLPARAGTARFERRFHWQPGALTVRDALSGPPGTAYAARIQLEEPLTQPPDLPDGAELVVEPCRRSRRYLSVEPAERAVVRGVVGQAGSVQLTWRFRAA